MSIDNPSDNSTHASSVRNPILVGQAELIEPVRQECNVLFLGGEEVDRPDRWEGNRVCIQVEVSKLADDLSEMITTEHPIINGVDGLSRLWQKLITATCHYRSENAEEINASTDEITVDWHEKQIPGLIPTKDDCGNDTLLSPADGATLNFIVEAIRAASLCGDVKAEDIENLADELQIIAQEAQQYEQTGIWPLETVIAEDAEGILPPFSNEMKTHPGHKTPGEAIICQTVEVETMNFLRRHTDEDNDNTLSQEHDES